jgi:hypothetical protein
VGNDGVNRWDYLGLMIIDSFSQAIKHYWFGLEKETTAGRNVINNLRNSKGWTKNKKAVEEGIKKSLTEVPCCDLNGTIQRKGKDIGIYAEDNILGHVTLKIDDYTVDWSTSHTGKNRLIEGTATRKVSFSDKFSFEVNLFSPDPKQILTDVIPAILAGDGSAYSIDGNFEDKITLSVNQTCP